MHSGAAHTWYWLGSQVSGAVCPRVGYLRSSSCCFLSSKGANHRTPTPTPVPHRESRTELAARSQPLAQPGLSGGMPAMLARPAAPHMPATPAWQERCHFRTPAHTCRPRTGTVRGIGPVFPAVLPRALQTQSLSARCGQAPRRWTSRPAGTRGTGPANAPPSAGLEAGASGCSRVAQGLTVACTAATSPPSLRPARSAECFCPVVHPSRGAGESRGRPRVTQHTAGGSRMGRSRAEAAPAARGVHTCPSSKPAPRPSQARRRGQQQWSSQHRRPSVRKQDED